MLAMRVAVVSCVLSLLAAPGPVRAEPVIAETIDYFDVTGATPQEVRASLDRLAPTSVRDGKRYDALTYPTIAWRFTFRGLPTCAITGTTVTAKIVIRFPRLAANAAAPAALKQSFSRYTDKLMKHQQAHAQKAIETARQIETGIAGLPPVHDCKGLEKAANHLGHNLITSYNRWRRDYDDRTLHGRVQGVKFP
jgi:predicted secreted Zn-dependent protease